MKYDSAEEEFWHENDEYLSAIMDEGHDADEAFAIAVDELDEYWRVLQEEYDSERD